MLSNALHTLVAQLPGPVFIKDTQGNYLMANVAAAKVFGLDDPASMIGKTDLELRPDNAEAARATWNLDQQAMLGGGPSTTEISVVDPKTGQLRWYLSNKSPLYDEDAVVVGIIGTSQDITPIKAAETLAQQQKDAALAAEQMKSRFLASVSHDLRQPLQAMLTIISGLSRHVIPGGQTLLSRMEAAMLTQKKLLDSLLDISLLDAGLTTPVEAEFPLNEVISQIKVGFNSAAMEKSLALIDAITEHEAVVCTDRAMLTRILSNLVENAIRFTEPGGEIELAAKQEGSHVYLTIRDTGIGIAADQLDLIWNEFHQVGNRARAREQGMGLGLSVVRRICTLLGLNITARSEFGVGSTFCLTVPCTSFKTALADEPGAPATKPFLVLIDDDPLVRDTFEMVLEDWGYPMISASNTLDALTKLEGRAKPDMLILDYRLEDGETGIDAVKAIRDYCQGFIPAILLTGDLAMSLQKLAAESEMHLLHKPVSMRELSALIETMLPAAI